MRYRKNVAVVVLNEAGLILAGERSDIAGAWQLPQGGIEEGETAEQAMFRELSEEIGTEEVDLVEVLPNRIRYTWPEEHWRGGFHGQEQTYFVVRLRKGAKLAKTTEEFRTFRWVRKDEFLELTNDFKREAYIEAFRLLSALRPDIFK